MEPQSSAVVGDATDDPDPLILALSPLCTQTGHFRPKHRVRLDAIRYGLVVIDVAHQRLLRGLRSVSTATEADRWLAFAHVYADAWTVVDTLHRVRRLLAQIAGMKVTPQFAALSTCCANLTPIRDAYQHIDERIGSFASSASPAWGYLKWSERDTEPGQFLLHALYPGALMDVAGAALDPSVLPALHAVDHVEIEIPGVTFAVSKAVESLRPVAHRLEQAIAQASAGKLSSRDAHVYLKVRPAST